MKKFISKLVRFSVPLALYAIFAMFFLPHLLMIQNGPNTEEQIEESFKNAVCRDYEILILGNSRMYRGVNPDKFSLETYNFSHDYDSYNQLYYKLKFLEKKEFNYLILGIDYFQFSIFSSKRNYVYGDLLNNQYIDDYKEYFLWSEVNYHLSFLDPKKLLGLRSKTNVPFLKENGQYIKPGMANKNDFVERDISRKQIQIKYFEKILDYCESRNIRVILVMPPTRENELNSYSLAEIKAFNQFINEYTKRKNVNYFNFSKDSSFKISDFTDITHLNQSAADNFSSLLDRKILANKTLDIEL